MFSRDDHPREPVHRHGDVDLIEGDPIEEDPHVEDRIDRDARQRYTKTNANQIEKE